MSKLKKICLSLIIIIPLLAGVTMACLAGAGIFNSGKKPDPTTGKYASVNELWTSSAGFNGTNMQTLFNMLGNKSGASINDLEALGTKTAEDIRANTTGKTSSQDIVVTLGGLNWEVVYLSKDTDGNTILTLWLSSNKQSAWTSNSATEGDYYGFLEGGLYSDWAANWWDMSFTAQTYPSNMYGTSYIRAVTLNNGGSYVAAKDADSLTSFSPTSSSVFANFTLSSSELTKYIVKPNKVSWQLDQTVRGIGAGISYDLPNDSLNNPTGAKWYTNSTYGSADMTEKPNYEDWGNDNIWLPSFTETGYEDTCSGLWKVSVSQRQNGDGSSTSSPGQVGQTSDSASPYSWLRSGYHYSAYWSYNLDPSGAGTGSYNVDYSYAVRPALHLNLSKIAKENAGNGSLPASTSSTEGADSQSVSYKTATAEQLAYLLNQVNSGKSEIYDGQNYNISGINIDSTNDYAGLFACLADATVSNTNITDGFINLNKNAKFLFFFDLFGKIST